MSVATKNKKSNFTDHYNSQLQQCH